MTKPFGLRYAVNERGTMTTQEKWFATDEARQKWIANAEQQDWWLGAVSYYDPE